MKNKKLIRNLFFVLIFGGLIFYFFIQKEKVEINSKDYIAFKHLDIILSSGQSFQSKLLSLLNLNNSTFTHIGVLIKEKDSVYVLHSTPDGTKDNSIRFDDIQTFINLSKVNYIKVLRFKKLDYLSIHKTDSLISIFRNIEIQFDYKFDNLDRSQIYCSELVYDLFNESGLLKTKINLNKPIYPDQFLNFKELECTYERKSTANEVQIAERVQ